MPADKDLSNAKLKGADASVCHVWAFHLRGPDFSGPDFSESNLQRVNLTKAKMQDARLPAWSSGRLTGVKLAEAEVCVPSDKDLSQCDLPGADLSRADGVEGINLRDTTLCAAILHAAKAPATRLDVVAGFQIGLPTFEGVAQVSK